MLSIEAFIPAARDRYLAFGSYLDLHMTLQGHLKLSIVYFWRGMEIVRVHSNNLRSPAHFWQLWFLKL